MAFNIIIVIVLILAVFGLVVSAIGYMSFTRAFKKEYAVVTYHMADTATTLINGEKQMFTAERMIKTLNQYKERTPKEIIEGVHQSVDAFAGEADQFDDLTMLCLEVKH